MFLDMLIKMSFIFCVFLLVECIEIFMDFVDNDYVIYMMDIVLMKL